MSEVSRIVTHYLEAIVRKAKLTGFDEMRAEIEAAEKQDDAIMEELTMMLRRLGEEGKTVLEELRDLKELIDPGRQQEKKDILQ